jgi:hypothetical protein
MRHAFTGFLPALALALAAMGAGPCELLDMLGDVPDGGTGDCEETPCENRLDVRIIRADNDGFWSGQYRFAIGLPDGSVYSVDCFLPYEETGFECDLGDTEVLFPVLDGGGAVIRLEVAGAPERLVLAVEHSGALIGERELVPAYEEINPGGDGCPVCLVGEDSMAVTAW